MLYYMNFYFATQGKTVSMPIYAGNRPKAESIAEELARKLSIRAYVLEYPAELTTAEIVEAM